MEDDVRVAVQQGDYTRAAFVGGVRNDLKDAANAIAGQFTQCTNGDLKEDQVEAFHDYKGETSSSADIDGNATTKAKACISEDQTDGMSVVDWGDIDLEGDVLALACFWVQNKPNTARNKAVQSDVRLNKVDHRRSFTTDVSADCPGPYWSVRTIMTHEFGHSFGLRHVNESAHGNLTMSKHINGMCQESEVTLGNGDIQGLRELY